MFPVEWTQEMSLGIKEIDDQHKGLFRTMKQLQEAIREKRESDVMIATFNALFDYTSTHFTLEESYFAKFNYPQTEAHVSAHRFMLNELQNKHARMSKDLRAMSEELMVFLEVWLAGHIMVMDKQYEKTFKEHGLGDDAAVDPAKVAWNETDG